MIDSFDNLLLMLIEIIGVARGRFGYKAGSSNIDWFNFPQAERVSFERIVIRLMLDDGLQRRDNRFLFTTHYKINNFNIKTIYRFSYSHD